MRGTSLAVGVWATKWSTKQGCGALMSLEGPLQLDGQEGAANREEPMACLSD